MDVPGDRRRRPDLRARMEAEVKAVDRRERWRSWRALIVVVFAVLAVTIGIGWLVRQL